MTNVKILSASYGTREQAIVVTEKVQQLVNEGHVRIEASHKHFQDPSPGQTKHLAVTYEIDGVRLGAACEEKQSILLTEFPQANWMSRIDGSKSLAELNIPGTHDSCSLFGGLMTECQTLTIRAQLLLGVRFLDIRCRHYNNVFTIHHGAFYQKINFGEVLNQCLVFLENNPSETIIMCIKPEPDPSGNTRTFEETFEHYMHGCRQSWYVSNEIPSLEKVRGKIVLVRRFEGVWGIPAQQGWKGNSVFTLNDDISSEGLNQKIKVQDYYKVPYSKSGYEEKWIHINSLAIEASKGKPDVWYWNFINGTSSGFPDANNPRATAVGKGGMNKRLRQYLPELTNKRVGTIVLDFVENDGLLDKIIELN